MKLKISPFLFLLFFGCSFPKGEYVNHWGIGSNSVLKFEKNNKVISLWGNDLGCCKYSFGKYEIRGDTLHLKFNKPDWYHEFGQSNFSIKKIEGHSIEKAKIRVRVLDEKSRKPAVFASVQIYKNEDFITSIEAGFHDFGEIDISKEDFPIYMEVRYLGYRNQRVFIKEKDSFEITFLMEEEPGSILDRYRIQKEDKNELFQIVKNTKDSLTLKSWTEDSDEVWFSKYARSERKYLSSKKLKKIKYEYRKYNE